ncbi:hypothetical protein Pcinc_030024 [Petrolisthes cinctipes]|uniref:Uncharacterized protein n=1 Tax=Petrolisthes cinctipes TaxID=88211 RepID=A0AAE1K6X7_PETCI|nr:hypothetical protein Pcinc_030024 [Petrolisthes cinctipes]
MPYRLSGLLLVVAVAAAVTASPINPFQASGALQILQRLGLDRGGQRPSITMAERLQQGDSPVYYIKLPPLPYYYVNNHLNKNAHTPKTPQVTTFPFEKVDVDFTNNGRPTQVYHWTQGITMPALWRPSTPPTTTTTTTTTPSPTTTTTTTTARPFKKPSWLTLNEYFPYNGRPSGVYVYKTRPPVSANKYKQLYFKHFNY